MIKLFVADYNSRIVRFERYLNNFLNDFKDFSLRLNIEEESQKQDKINEFIMKKLNSYIKPNLKELRNAIGLLLDNYNKLIKDQKFTYKNIYNAEESIQKLKNFSSSILSKI